MIHNHQRPKVILNNESKDTLKKYVEMWIKIRDLIRSITNKSGNYDEEDMKIKFNSDDVPLSKTPKLCIIIVVRIVFHMKTTNITPSFLRRMFV